MLNVNWYKKYTRPAESFATASISFRKLYTVNRITKSFFICSSPFSPSYAFASTKSLTPSCQRYVDNSLLGSHLFAYIYIESELYVHIVDKYRRLLVCRLVMDSRLWYLNRKANIWCSLLVAKWMTLLKS